MTLNPSRARLVTFTMTLTLTLNPSRARLVTFAMTLALKPLVRAFVQPLNKLGVGFQRLIVNVIHLPHVT